MKKQKKEENSPPIPHLLQAQQPFSTTICQSSRTPRHWNIYIVRLRFHTCTCSAIYVESCLCQLQNCNSHCDDGAVCHFNMNPSPVRRGVRGLRTHPSTVLFLIMQFFTRNRIYTPKFGYKIAIFLRFALAPPRHGQILDIRTPRPLPPSPPPPPQFSKVCVRA